MVTESGLPATLISSGSSTVRVSGRAVCVPSTTRSTRRLLVIRPIGVPL
jgi:hypothetical protein